MNGYSIKYTKSYITICVFFIDSKNRIQYNEDVKSYITCYLSKNKVN